MDKIRNPTTGRLIKKTSILGKKIANGYIPPEKPCKVNKIKNPNTKRCVLETGKIAQKILNSNSPFNKEVTLPKSSIDILPNIAALNIGLKSIPKLPPATLSHLEKLDKIQKIKEKNKAAKDIQKVFKGYLARKKNPLPLNFQDTMDFPQPFTTAQADAILNQQIIDNEYKKSLFYKDPSLPKSKVDILLGVRDINKIIRESNKPKIKRTNKRSKYN